jgi:hypothetical protein
MTSPKHQVETDSRTLETPELTHIEAEKTSTCMGRTFKKIGDFFRGLPWKKIGCVAAIVFGALLAISFGAVVGWPTAMIAVAMLGIAGTSMWAGIHFLKKKEEAAKEAISQ